MVAPPVAHAPFVALRPLQVVPLCRTHLQLHRLSLLYRPSLQDLVHAVLATYLAQRPGHALFRASTWTNAHNLPPDYISELGYSGAFAKQEIEGQFVAFEGLVYTLDASANGHLAEPPQRDRWQWVIGGVDCGYTNPSAAAIFALDGDGGVWQVDEFYQRRAGLEETLLPVLLDLTRRYGVETWYCGPDEPEHIDALAAALAREGLASRAQRADNSVHAVVRRVVQAGAVETESPTPHR